MTTWYNVVSDNCFMYSSHGIASVLINTCILQGILDNLQSNATNLTIWSIILCAQILIRHFFPSTPFECIIDHQSNSKINIFIYYTEQIIMYQNQRETMVVNWNLPTSHWALSWPQVTIMQILFLFSLFVPSPHYQPCGSHPCASLPWLNVT